MMYRLWRSFISISTVAQILSMYKKSGELVGFLMKQLSAKVPMKGMSTSKGNHTAINNEKNIPYYRQ